MPEYKVSWAAARVNAGMKQSEVAKIMQVSKNTIINWEKGKVIPKPAEFEMMCRIYNVPKDMIKV